MSNDVEVEELEIQLYIVPPERLDEPFVVDGRVLPESPAWRPIEASDIPGIAPGDLWVWVRGASRDAIERVVLDPEVHSRVGHLIVEGSPPESFPWDLFQDAPCLRSIQMWEASLDPFTEGFESLEMITMSREQLDDDWVAALVRLPQLWALQFRFSSVTDEHLRALSEKSSLRLLDLDWGTRGYSLRGVIAVLQNVPLEYLSLELPFPGHEDLSPMLSLCPSLRSIWMDGISYVLFDQIVAAYPRVKIGPER